MCGEKLHMQVVQPKQWQRAGRTFYVGGGGFLSISVIVIQPELDNKQRNHRQWPFPPSLSHPFLATQFWKEISEGNPENRIAYHQEIDFFFF